MPPLFVHTTVEPTAIVMLAGVKPEFVMETWTVVGCSFGVGVVAWVGTTATTVGVAVGLAACAGVAVGASEGVAVRPVVDWSEGVEVATEVDADLCPNKVETL
jgi:hypothetical protein